MREKGKHDRGKGKGPFPRAPIPIPPKLCIGTPTVLSPGPSFCLPPGLSFCLSASPPLRLSASPPFCLSAFLPLRLSAFPLLRLSAFFPARLVAPFLVRRSARRRTQPVTFLPRWGCPDFFARQGSRRFFERIDLKVIRDGKTVANAARRKKMHPQRGKKHRSHTAQRSCYRISLSPYHRITVSARTR